MKSCHLFRTLLARHQLERPGRVSDAGLFCVVAPASPKPPLLDAELPGLNELAGLSRWPLDLVRQEGEPELRPDRTGEFMEPAELICWLNGFSAARDRRKGGLPAAAGGLALRSPSEPFCPGASPDAVRECDCAAVAVEAGLGGREEPRLLEPSGTWGVAPEDPVSRPWPPCSRPRRSRAAAFMSGGSCGLRLELGAVLVAGERGGAQSALPLACGCDSISDSLIASLRMPCSPSMLDAMANGCGVREAGNEGDKLGSSGCCCCCCCASAPGVEAAELPIDMLRANDRLSCRFCSALLVCLDGGENVGVPAEVRNAEREYKYNQDIK